MGNPATGASKLGGGGRGKTAVRARGPERTKKVYRGGTVEGGGMKKGTVGILLCIGGR